MQKSQGLKRFRAVRRPIMQGHVPVRLQLVVPFFAVVFQAAQADQVIPVFLHAARFVEPAQVQDLPGLLDTGLMAEFRGYPKVDAHLHGRLQPAFALQEQLAHFDVVRRPVHPVPVTVQVLVREENVTVMIHAFPGVLVIPEDMDFPANVLGEPDAGRIVHAQVPPRIDQGCGRVRHPADPALFSDFRKLRREIGALDRPGERLVRCARVLPLHVLALHGPFFDVPRLLRPGEFHARERVVKIFLLITQDLDRFHEDVQRVQVPREKKELVVHLREVAAGLLQVFGRFAHIVKQALPAFRRAFDNYDLAGMNGVQCARLDLGRLVRVCGGDLPELADVNELKCAGPARRGDLDARPVAETQHPGRIRLGPAGFLDFLGQAVISELDVPVEKILRVLLVVRNDRRVKIRHRQRTVQTEQATQGRHPVLPALQNDIAIVHPQIQKRLHIIHAKRNVLALLVDNTVQMIHPPPLVTEMQPDFIQKCVVIPLRP